MRSIAFDCPHLEPAFPLLAVARQGFCQERGLLLLRARRQALPPASQGEHPTILEAAINSLHTDEYVHADHWGHAIGFLEALAQSWRAFSPGHPDLEALVTLQGTTRGVHVSLTAARPGWSNCPKDLHGMVLPIMETRLLTQRAEEQLAA